jgi:hypothetical protein
MKHKVSNKLLVLQFYNTFNNYSTHFIIPLHTFYNNVINTNTKLSISIASSNIRLQWMGYSNYDMEELCKIHNDYI